MPKKTGEKAAVYARYSSHNQQEQSIEGQLAAAQKYAIEKGYTIVQEYCDRAKTGTNDNREAFQRMLSDCAKKQFSVIIVWKVDRFGRNRQEITFNKYHCKKHGVRIEYVAENISDGPEGIILEGLLESMAEYYSVQLSQNVQRGLLESAKKHHVLGGQITLGYRAAKDKTYEIDPVMGPFVKEIFTMYADGSTESEIAAYMNSKGIRTQRGVAFNRSSLQRVLKNERYIGTYVFKDIIHDENAIPAIVDKETFYRVQQRLKENRRAPSHCWNHSDYLLTGKLFCGDCGATMVGVSGTGKAGRKYCYYTCLNHWKDKSCSRKAIRQDQAEILVLGKIRDLLNDDDTMDRIADLAWTLCEKETADNAEVLALKSELAGVEKSIRNLIKGIEMGIIGDEIQDRITELRSQKADLETAIAKASLTGPVKLTKDLIVYFLYQFREMDLTDRKMQRRLVDTFVNSVYAFDDTLVVSFNYSGEGNTMKIEDIKKAAYEPDKVFVSDGTSWALSPAYEHLPIFYMPKHVFIVTIKIPET